MNPDETERPAGSLRDQARPLIDDRPAWMRCADFSWYGVLRFYAIALIVLLIWEKFWFPGNSRMHNGLNAAALAAMSTAVSEFMSFLKRRRKTYRKAPTREEGQ